MWTYARFTDQQCIVLGMYFFYYQPNVVSFQFIHRHLILGTTAFYLVKGMKFPAVKEAIYRAYKGIDPDWDGVKIHLSILTSKIDQAIRHVQDVNTV